MNTSVKAGLIIAFIFISDQVTKYWVLSVFDLPGWCAENRVFPCQYPITSFFNLAAGWNTGISFGLFNTGDDWNKVIISALVIGVTIWLLLWYRKTESGLLQFALPVVIGGALGNLVDRIYHGAVFDFLDFHAFGWHWYTFNIADSAIVIGVILIARDGLFSDEETAKQGPNGPSDDGAQGG